MIIKLIYNEYLKLTVHKYIVTTLYLLLELNLLISNELKYFSEIKMQSS